MTAMVKETFYSLVQKYTTDEAHPGVCWQELHQLYTAPSRYYQTLEHVAYMLQQLIPVASQVQNWDALLFSVYYHDSIYKIPGSQNEEKSAQLFQKRISPTTFQHIEHVKQQILSTKTHVKSTDTDTNLLLDADLSILGENENTYNTYRLHIRKEYHIYPDMIYNRERIKILKRLLARETIYKTDDFKEKFEEKARQNIAMELLLLKK